MSNTYTNYIEFDTNERCPIKKIGCMVCNKTIAIREKRKIDNQLRVKYFSNIKRPRVILEDETYADLLVCEGCENTSIDLKRMTKTLHSGWMNEENWKYIISTNQVHKKIKKLQFNLKANDLLPISYFKKLFKNKKILKRSV